MTHLLLLAAVVIWGFTFVAAKVCLVHMTTLQLVASRFVMAAPALYDVARWRGASFRLGAFRGRLAWAAAIFSLHFLAQWFWQVGIAKLGAAKAGSFLYLEPLATTALAASYLKEPLGVEMLAGGTLVLAGVFIAERARVGCV